MSHQLDNESPTEGLGKASSVKRRVLLVASGGGHWVQLNRLRRAFESYETLYATTLSGVATPSGYRPVANICDASRTEPWKIPVLVLQLLWIICKFRPNFIVTTGAGPGLIAIRIGKWFGARTVWIDSMANSETLSLSGAMAERYADLWLTQWPHLAESNPKLQFFGRVI